VGKDGSSGLAFFVETPAFNPSQGQHNSTPLYAIESGIPNIMLGPAENYEHALELLPKNIGRDRHEKN
jgi:hypothetical protein